jgi:hypothetical protein
MYSQVNNGNAVSLQPTQQVRARKTLPKPVPWTPELWSKFSPAMPSPDVKLPTPSFSKILGSIVSSARAVETPQNLGMSGHLEPQPPLCSSVQSLDTSATSGFKLTGNAEFESAVRQAAGTNCEVVLTLGNAKFLPMMLNLLASFARVSAQRVFIVGLSPNVCDASDLAATSAVCFQYAQHFQEGNFGSAAFATLVHVKTEVALSVLALGYKVLLIDADIVMVKDPLDGLAASAATWDLQIQDDAEGGRNSGFMYLAPRSITANFLARALKIGRSKRDMRQQPAVNQALQEMKDSMNVKVLYGAVLTTDVTWSLCDFGCCA